MIQQKGVFEGVPVCFKGELEDPIHCCEGSDTDVLGIKLNFVTTNKKPKVVFEKI
jgi:hypothetical protein